VSPATPHQNPVNKFDVDGDGIVAPIDALFIVNHLNLNLPAVLPPINTTSVFLDVSGDNFVSPIDFLLIINWLNGF